MLSIHIIFSNIYSIRLAKYYYYQYTFLLNLLQHQIRYISLVYKSTNLWISSKALQVTQNPNQPFFIFLGSPMNWCSHYSFLLIKYVIILNICTFTLILYNLRPMLKDFHQQPKSSSLIRQRHFYGRCHLIQRNPLEHTTIQHFPKLGERELLYGLVPGALLLLSAPVSVIFI